MTDDRQILDHHSEDMEGRLERLERRIDALDGKLDVVTEAIRGDIKTVLERVDGLSAEMRREFGAVRKEQRADHRLVMAVLQDHAVRVTALERRGAQPRKRRRD